MLHRQTSLVPAATGAPPPPLPLTSPPPTSATQTYAKVYSSSLWRLAWPLPSGISGKTTGDAQEICMRCGGGHCGFRTPLSCGHFGCRSQLRSASTRSIPKPVRTLPSAMWRRRLLLSLLEHWHQGPHAVRIRGPETPATRQSSPGGVRILPLGHNRRG